MYNKAFHNITRTLFSLGGKILIKLNHKKLQPVGNKKVDYFDSENDLGDLEQAYKLNICKMYMVSLPRKRQQ